MIDKPKKHYVRNKDLLPEIEICREQEKISEKLGAMLVLIVKNYSKKSNWSNYTYAEDMRGHALLHLTKAALKFDPTRSNNPFAYYTQITKHAFIQVLKQEKKHRDIRDSQLVSVGLDPSFSFLEHCKQEDEERKQALIEASGGENTGNDSPKKTELEAPGFQLEEEK